jgi:hypothetical protein
MTQLHCLNEPHRMMERDTGLTFQLGDVTWHCWVVDGGRYEWRSSCQRFRVWRHGNQVLASCDGRPARTQRTLRAAMIFAQHEGILRDHGFRKWEALAAVGSPDHHDASARGLL